MAAYDIIQPWVFDELVTVQLEDCEESFAVSKALLCRASTYFQKALNGEFLESSRRTLKLPGCSEDTFRLFMHYLVNEGRLPAANLEGTSAEEVRAASAQCQVAMINLWIFGDGYLMPDLQNCAMLSLAGVLAKRAVRPEAVELAFTNTQDKAPLRRLLVDEAVRDWKYGQYSKDDSMDRLGAVPAFFAAFAEKLAKCPLNDCPHKPDCSPSRSKVFSPYLVDKSGETRVLATEADDEVIQEAAP